MMGAEANRAGHVAGNETDRTTPVVAAAVRTPIGKARGVYSAIDAYRLGAIVIRESVGRAEIDPADLTEVIMGNLLALPGNVARVCALAADVPDSVPALTLDRQCASGLDAVAYAATMIRAGRGGIYFAGGTESMTRAPYYLERQSKPYSPVPPAFLPAMLTPPEKGSFTMGETAENLAVRFGVPRERQDRYAAESHARAWAATKGDLFMSQIVPVPPSGAVPLPGATPAAGGTGAAKPGSEPVLRDESIRPDTTPETLAKLKPAFSAEGTVTAGNSCPTNDGAGGMIVLSKETARERGIRWLAEITDWSSVGLDPRFMGMGPIFAVRDLLKRTGLAMESVDLFELNEAFAVQTLVCVDELGIPEERLNVNGGAIALGHPLGATGAILATKLVYEMERRDAATGIVTMCVGGGQVAAMLFRREI